METVLPEPGEARQGPSPMSLKTFFINRLGEISKRAPQFVVEILDRPDPRPILAQAIFCGQAAFNKRLPRDQEILFVKNGPSSTRKRVVVRKLDKGLIKGFLDPNGYLASEIEVLDREGRLVHVPMSEIKGVFFVRDFEGNPGPCRTENFPQSPPAGRTLGANDLQRHRGSGGAASQQSPGD